MKNERNNHEPAHEDIAVPIKRPWALSILSILVLSIGCFHLFSITQIIKNSDVLQNISINVSLFYLIIKSSIWAIWGPFLAWSIWQGRNWSQISSIIFGSLYCLIFWVDRLWIAEPQISQTRLGINLIFSILGLLGIISIVSQKSSRQYFKGNPVKIP